MSPHPKPTEPRPARIQIKRVDGKARRPQGMMANTLCSADGKLMPAIHFLESLFGTLPESSRDEDLLREIRSDPPARKTLLLGLADKGSGREALTEMQKAIGA
ncbi:MAG: hypothetical protein ABIO17_11465 [Pseudoxanthomonas sp.]